MLVRRRAALCGIISLIVLLSGCWAKPHRIGVWQGNIIQQTALDSVTVGMTREQVDYLLGTPVVRQPFDKQRWDYLYLYQPGEGEPTRRLVSIYFEGEKVARIEGDLKAPGAEKPTEEEEALDLTKNLPEAITPGN